MDVGISHFYRQLLNALKDARNGIKLHMKRPKIIYGSGSTPYPAGGAYDAFPDPVVAWGGGYPQRL